MLNIYPALSTVDGSDRFSQLRREACVRVPIVVWRSSQKPRVSSGDTRSASEPPLPRSLCSAARATRCGVDSKTFHAMFSSPLKLHLGDAQKGCCCQRNAIQMKTRPTLGLHAHAKKCQILQAMQVKNPPPHLQLVFLWQSNTRLHAYLVFKAKPARGFYYLICGAFMVALPFAQSMAHQPTTRA